MGIMNKILQISWWCLIPMMNIIVMRLLQCDIKQGTYIEDMSHVCWREDEEGGRENVTVI
jgi:hypothetical protein